MKKNQSKPADKGQFLVYQSEDGRIKIDVRRENETVWLTQQTMAKLFQTTQQNISLHLQNIYAEGELQQEATHKDFLLVQKEGTRQVPRPAAPTLPDVVRGPGGVERAAAEWAGVENMTI